MNENTIVKKIAEESLTVCKDKLLQYNDSALEIFFQPNERYADSFLRVERKDKGFNWFRPRQSDPNAPIEEVVINITLKPKVMKDEWVGYSLFIENPQTNPKIGQFILWPEAGGQYEASMDQLASLEPHILALLACPLMPDKVQPPHESPKTMY